MTDHQTASRAEWLEARTALLAEEKRLAGELDALAARRRALPWVKVEKHYEFDSRNGTVSLGDLFSGRSQLIVQHFMLAPGQDAPCPSCSFWADGYNGTLMHLAARDISFVVVSRAPLGEIEACRQRMGWDFEWVSSGASTFNFDYGVTATDAEVAAGETEYNYRKGPVFSREMPGASAFYRNPDGTIFHTYSTYARGLDRLNATYAYMDIAPLGRNEDDLPFPMAWVKRHDEY